MKVWTYVLTFKHTTKPLVFVICLMPLGILIWQTVNNDLGANPVEAITHETGTWSLRFLLLTLVVSPLRHWTGKGIWLRFRRMFGLYAFFYTSCHFLIWVVADHALAVSDMFADIIERPYLTVGFLALLGMLPLAFTSNQAMIRRLGRGWQRLHKLTYWVVVLAILHYLWLVKVDYREAATYAAIGALLLFQRIKYMSVFRTLCTQVLYYYPTNTIRLKNKQK